MTDFRKLALLAAGSMLAGCASQAPVGGAPDVTVSQANVMPAPGTFDLAPSTSTALIRPLDVIEVDVFGVEELSRTLQVSANGNIDFPLVGSVQAAGITMEELTRIIEDRLRQSYVREPDVTARITERNAQNFTIGGEITNPGRFGMTEPVTLMEAVAIGGGVADYAQRDEVLIFREIGDERYIGVYNIEGIQRGNYADPLVYPGDIVMVGENTGRRRLDQILRVTSSVLAPLVLIERVVNR